MKAFEQAVANELTKARSKHRPLNSLHEGYAVLLEEVDEFWEEVKKRAEVRDRSKLAAELVQVAAMCQRLAEDCRLDQHLLRVTDLPVTGEAA